MTEQPNQPPGPQPVPQQVIVSMAQGPQGNFVMVQIIGPTGTFVTFFDPDAAEQIAGQIADTAAHARSGLVVARGLAELNGQASR